MSCVFGVPAFISSFLAAYSQQYRVRDLENPLLAPVVNTVLKPIAYLKGKLFPGEMAVEPTMSPLDMAHILESDAISVFYITGVLLGITAIYFFIKAAKIKEYSFWYANGGFTGLTALALSNIYIGILSAIITGLIFSKIIGINRN